jgi:response regulator RpfG family c-di-GMP phosphodiesterase
MPNDDTVIRTYDAVKALAFIGDLSMGQPTDHSARTGWLAHQVAQAADMSPAACDAVREAALLRWSGCTANAPGFAEKFGDDVATREAMLAQRPDWTRLASVTDDLGATLTPLAQIHCEVSTEVARLLGLSDRTQATLRQVFESWDGHGIPEGRRGADVEPAVFVVAIAGDLEILARVYGVEQALELISRQADRHYPAALANVVRSHARQWLLRLDAISAHELDAALCTTQLENMTAAPALIADIIDLKLPWMTGYSREVARTAVQCHGRLSNDEKAASLVYQAGLIHGIGRAAVPNTVWNTPGKLSPSAWEKIRLVPYWTSRAGRQGGSLAAAAELASYAYERCDGSGYFRGAGGTALSLEAQVLAAAAAWVALRSPRPWRDAYAHSDAQNILRGQAAQGLFRNDVIDALLSPDDRSVAPASSPLQPTRLSPREIDVLRLISRGASNKEAAKTLALSPSTVGTHIESLFRKLECSTRAAATLKASAAGLL